MQHTSRVDAFVCLMRVFIRQRSSLRTSDTHIYIAARLAVELSIPVLRLRSVASGIRTLNLPLADHNNGIRREYVMQHKLITHAITVG